MSSGHTDKAFEQDLTNLRAGLLEMGKKVEQAIADGMSAVSTRDLALAESVIQNDAVVNRLEVEIDDDCRRILALRQPAASDLRLITTAVKIVTDLERIGDLAVNIAERVGDLTEAPPPNINQGLSQLASLAQAQLHAALDAFVTANVPQAEQVLGGDVHVDALFVKLFNELLALMMEDSKNIRRATAVMFMAKHLERIGDHAQNLAEMVIYMVQGTDVRHPKSRKLPR